MYVCISLLIELLLQLLNWTSNSSEEEDILIFDLGGGTFDVTVLNIKKHKIGEEIPVWEVRTLK